MKKQIIIASILLISLVLIINVSAYQKVCLGRGEIIIPINYTCEHDFCIICVTDDLHQANLNSCEDIYCKSLSEVSFQENTSFTDNPNVTNNSNVTNFTEITNPQITIEPFRVSLNSPIEGNIYSKIVLFNITSEREINVYYSEDGEWKTLSTDRKSYFKKINFNEGFHNITIRVVDNSNYEKNFTVGFYVDNGKPRIRKVGPSRGYLNGNFNIEFMEKNPKSLLLKYGNSLTGYRDYNVDFNDCFLDSISRCNLNINLSDYNNQNIYYWFVLKDISGNSAETKHIQLGVDALSPQITNPDSIFKLDPKSKAVTFNISVLESNFAKVMYLDRSQRVPKWNLLCSKLTKGYCVKKLTFVRGTHDIDIQVLDKAGNYVTQSIEFDI
ncbi:MAG: hypothetical protein WC979_08415 [Candidatus Pacearchaeota archaeon]|jgi:hypothetical protein